LQHWTTDDGQAKSRNISSSGVVSVIYLAISPVAGVPIIKSEVAMNSYCWLTDMQHFSIQLHCYGGGCGDVFNGTVSMQGIESPLAFSGLAEFWLAVKKLRSLNTVPAVESTPHESLSVYHCIKNAANDFC